MSFCPRHHHYVTWPDRNFQLLNYPQKGKNLLSQASEHIPQGCKENGQGLPSENGRSPICSRCGQSGSQLIVQDSQLGHTGTQDFRNRDSNNCSLNQLDLLFHSLSSSGTVPSLLNCIQLGGCSFSLPWLGKLLIYENKNKRGGLEHLHRQECF